MMMIFFFFLVRGCVLIILYYNITLLHSAILHTHTYRNAYISMIVFICLNCCFCIRVRWVCVMFVCGQVLDGVLSSINVCEENVITVDRKWGVVVIYVFRLLICCCDLGILLGWISA